MMAAMQNNMAMYPGQHFYESSSGAVKNNIDTTNSDRDEDKFVNHSVPFPWKLHEMLEAADTDAFLNVVSWLPDRQSFKVHQVEAFVQDVMPKFFRQTKYKSFQRQLNMWGFERLLSGPNKGGYSHLNFVRGQPALCRHMKRLKIKGNSSKHASSPRGSPAPTLPARVPPRVISHESNNNRNMIQHLVQLQKQQENLLASQNASFPAQVPSQAQVTSSHQHASVPTQLTQQQLGDDLFDEDTLLSVLSTVIDSPSNPPENTPQNGDSCAFQGMQFFLVEETGKATRASRRMSIEFSGGLVGPAKRRFSLVGANSPEGIVSNGMGEPTRRRASRRFSLEQNVSSGYVFKQLVGMKYSETNLH